MALKDRKARKAIRIMCQGNFSWTYIDTGFKEADASLLEMITVLVFMIQNFHATSNFNAVAKYIYSKYSHTVDFNLLSSPNDESSFATAICNTINKTVDDDTIPEAMAKALIEIYFPN